MREAEAIGEDEARALLAPLAGCASLLLAVSGGPDSLAMMRIAAAVLRGEGSPPLFAATVDHGLREGSRREAEAVAQWATALAIPHATLTWEGPKPTTRVQERAREARYDLLRRHAAAIGVADLVTAHHGDDQAETVLMRLMAGTGPAGLAAMRPFTTREGLHHWRPLLGIAKARLVATLARDGHPYFSDPGNASPAQARGRLRRIMPLLAKEGLDRERLLVLARRAARAEDALAAMVSAAAARHLLITEGGAALGPGFFDEPLEIQLRLAAHALAGAGPMTARARLARLEGLTDALNEARHAGLALRRTMMGWKIALDRSGTVTLRREGPRRRGVRNGANG